MRPLHTGEYEADLAGLARLRRRVARDELEPLPWKRRVMKLCDQLHKELDEVVTRKALDKSDDKSKASPSKKRKPAASASSAAT